MRGAKIAQKQVRKASVPAAYFDLFQTITVSLLAPQRELGQEKGREGKGGRDGIGNTYPSSMSAMAPLSSPLELRPPQLSVV